MPLPQRPLSPARRGLALAMPLAAAAVLAAGCALAAGPERAAAPAARPTPVAASSTTPAGTPVAAPASAPAPSDRPGAAPATTPAATPAATAPPPEDFAAWRDGYRARALSAGVSASLFDRAFAGLTPNPRVLELDAFQPEFVRPVWQYLDNAISETRIANGRARAADHAALLARLEARHGVDRDVIVAVWGLESAYGTFMGDMSVIRSLATLAWDGRRREFAEEQLTEAFRIIAAGEVSAEGMTGSWAGAMGHTQFIPTSYTAYAVDEDGDGRRNIWGADPSDALASTANYLARFGWDTGAPAAVEVVLPAGFDYALADPSVRRAAGLWSALGVAAAGGGALPEGDASILAPAGARGPAFLTYDNFRTILSYNNASSYALAVWQLAERLSGAGPIRGEWPRGDRALRVEEVREIQRRLTALGHDTQGTDGIIGPNSRAAIRAFQRGRGLPADGVAGASLLDALRAAGG